MVVFVPRIQDLDEKYEYPADSGYREMKIERLIMVINAAI